MYTKQQLIDQLKAMEIDPKGTLLVHSALKPIGQVEGGADTVLDALCEYMRDGLLVLPTHTWSQMNEKYNVFDVVNEPSCVGKLTNLFRKREGVLRSFHPTHSVAAIGADAADYVSGEELTRTPCPRNGCWGKLYDRNATVLFLGCSLCCNTFLHGVEEWEDTPNRIAGEPTLFIVKTPDGTLIEVPQYRHKATNPVVESSHHYGKMEKVFVREGAMHYGTFGDAKCYVGNAVKMAHITARYLKRDYHLFDDNTPIDC